MPKAGSGGVSAGQSARDFVIGTLEQAEGSPRGFGGARNKIPVGTKIVVRGPLLSGQKREFLVDRSNGFVITGSRSGEWIDLRNQDATISTRSGSGPGTQTRLPGT